MLEPGSALLLFIGGGALLTWRRRGKVIPDWFPAFPLRKLGLWSRSSHCPYFLPMVRAMHCHAWEMQCLASRDWRLRTTTRLWIGMSRQRPITLPGPAGSGGFGFKWLNFAALSRLETMEIYRSRLHKDSRIRPNYCAFKGAIIRPISR